MFGRLKGLLKRPVSWGAVIIPYVAVMVALAMSVSSNASTRTEAHVRERDICTVVINVHTNAAFRRSTERASLESTKAYLDDPDTPHDVLYKRIRENLPAAEARVRAAEDNVKATTVPPTCRPYQKKRG